MEWRTPRKPSLWPAGFIEPCNPTISKKAPSGGVHEIKHDGSDFHKLHSQARNDDAFDLLELNGDDVRTRPLEKRVVALT